MGGVFDKMARAPPTASCIPPDSTQTVFFERVFYFVSRVNDLLKFFCFFEADLLLLSPKKCSEIAKICP